MSSMADDSMRDMMARVKIQARMAGHIYFGRHKAEQLALSLGAHCIYVEDDHLAAVAFIFRGVVHVSVAGTDDLYDAARNLSATQMPYHGLKAHGGFVEAADVLQKQFAESGLRSMIQRHGCGDRELILGGHSAGGAIAELLALTDWLTPREVITFGAPRVFAAGSAATYRAMGWPVHRFVIAGDPVPELPLRRFRCLFGSARYAHASSSLELTSEGRVLIGQEIGICRRMVRRVMSFVLYAQAFVGFFFGVRLGVLRLHSIEKYLWRVSKASDRLNNSVG